jgi:hypothetical protein
MNFAIDLIAPCQGLPVQVRQAVVLDPHHKIISDKLNRPFVVQKDAFRFYQQIENKL